MKSYEAEYKKIEGKTYSLFGDADSPEGYYKTIASITDGILSQGYTCLTLMKLIRDKSYFSGSLLSKLSSFGLKEQMNSFETIREPLYVYTQATKSHLRQFPFFKFWDRRLSTSELQYHLYMVEIELTNRIHIEIFKKSTWKIGLLPYCLREFDHDCKAVAGGFDVECKSCSKTCFTGKVSKLLRENEIKPYIWNGSDLKRFSVYARQRGEIPGVLGIACIPELTMGMRKCMKLDLPVIGLPLNANRCIRWTGNFHENSVYVEKLAELIR